MNEQRSDFKNLLAGIILVGCGCCLAGCSGSEADGKKAKSAPAQTEAPSAPDKIARGPVEQKLVGSWLGTAYIDESRLAEKLMELDPAKREIMIQRAEHFISTTMAYQFNVDGTMTNEVEIVPPGQAPVVDAVRGRWKVVAVEGLWFQLQNTESLPDGTSVDVAKEFQFYEGHDRMALKVPLGEVLGDCNPLIVFERSRPVGEQTAQTAGRELK